MVESQGNVEAETAEGGKKPGIFKRIGNWFKRIWQAVKPGRRAWKGAAFGLLIAAVGLWIAMIVSMVVPTPAMAPLAWLGMTLGGLLFATLVGGLLLLMVNLLKWLPTFYRWTLLGGTFVFGFVGVFGGRGPVGMIVVMLLGIASSSLVGAGIWVLAKGGLKDTTVVRRVIAIIGLVVGAGALAFSMVWLVRDGWAADPLPNAAAESDADVAPLSLPDPSQLGEYEVLTLSYGSGTDRHRPEYGEEVDLVTDPVDGSPFVEGWEGFTGWTLTSYWGFDVEALPVNARVWYPDGEGPFPLVLVVHGNHLSEDFSDPGYDYLGELLASRGFILASVDENFINSSLVSFISGLKEENDARGWLLLEHLRVWRDWNKTPGNPFYQRVDMDNIGIMGHSRGGEAVSEAAAFNRLPYYPDDATVAFDYNFNIRAVVAIAPVDGQYSPTGISTPMENVNYFVLHGANDGDVTSFDGQASYGRVAFTDDQYWFKAALYIFGANHGQFNTTWGRGDSVGLSNAFLNLRPLMPTEAQKQVARVYISAFLETTLHGEDGYIPLFRDYRAGADWLPDTIYLNQFADSTYRYVSTYEEDIDVETTTLPDGVQSSENLTVWREQLVEGKWENPFDTSAVFLGWDAEETEDVASYTITLPDGGVPLDADSVLLFSLADANEDPTPDDEKEDRQETEKEKMKEEGPRPSIDLTIEVIDAAGHKSSLPLSAFSFLQPQIEVQIMKAAFMDSTPPSEIVFQLFEFPLGAFVEVNPDFDPASLTIIHFVFDRTPAGVVVLDDVGFREGR